MSKVYEVMNKSVEYAHYGVISVLIVLGTHFTYEVIYILPTVTVTLTCTDL